MTQEYLPTSPPSGRPGLPRWFLIAILAVVTLGIAAVVIVLVVALGGDDEGGSEGDDGGPAEAETFDVKGEMSLISFEGGIFRYQGECSGQNGYDDMDAGAQVTVRDSKGETLAVGVLEAGAPDGAGTCTFPFTVEDVPSGQSIYSIEVSHRGEISFKEEDASSLTLTLG